jgi:PAS domain S-box-containing protein
MVPPEAGGEGMIDLQPSAAEVASTDVSELRQVVQRLTRAQKEYQDLIDTIDGIVWEADSSFRFLFVSRQAVRLLGYPVERWLKEPGFWAAHLHPDDRVWAVGFCQKATQECRPHEFEYRMVAADGRIVWLRDIVTVLAEGGRPFKLRGIMVDVTAQHESSESLERTVSLLRATLDSTADGLVVVDRSGNITAFNRRFQEMWGLSDEVLTSRWSDRVLASVLAQLQTPEQFLAREREFSAAPEAEGFDILELRDGQILERYSRPQRLGDATIGRVWSFRDVTQRVRAERERDRLLVAEHSSRAAAEESLALLDTFLNNAPVGLGFLDTDLRYIRINDSLATLHGTSRDKAIGRRLREQVPTMAPTIEPIMRQVLATGIPVIGIEVAGEVPSEPGQLRHWRVSYYPVKTPSGGIVGVGAVVVEVTAERLAQAERERLLREAQEAIHLRDDFLSIAAHELKTPLTPLKLHLQALKQHVATEQLQQPARVDKALSQVRRLAGLINDLLDVTRIEAGRLELERGPLVLPELVCEVVADFRPVCPQHHFECQGPAEPLVVLGDRGRLAQVLTNLLENAVKYSPLGGLVRVTVERRGAEAVVAVTDPGIGIPADQQEHLFERFFRARNAPISGFGGLGLGLYICRDIVQRHGGRIWVESELEHGSTFHVALPIQEPARSESPGSVQG